MNTVTSDPLCKSYSKESSLSLGRIRQQGEVAGEMYTLQWLHKGAKYGTIKWIPLNAHERTSKTNSEEYQNTAVNA